MISNLKGKRLRIALAITSAVTFILHGYDQALMNGLLTLQSFEETFPSIDTSSPEKAARNSLLQGTTVALYEVGAAIGALACFVIGSRYGRKRTTLGAAIVILMGVIIQASSYSLAQLIVARIITGLGIGAFTATMPSWVGESVEAAERGRFVMLQGAGAIFGVMFASWLELGFYFVGENPVSWRFPIAFQAFFLLVVLPILPFLPESPRWLISKDRTQEGTEVLARLEGEDVTSVIVVERVRAIRESLDADSQGHSDNPFARTPNSHLQRTLVAIAVNMLAQMSGVNIIIFYADVVFQNILGFSAVKTRVINSCLQTWQFLAATSSALFLIDRFGRRRLLLVCTALMAVAMAGLAGLQSHASNSVVAECSLIFYFIALAAFPIGLFLVPFLHSSELAPLRIRAKVTAMSASANWIFNFLVAEVTPTAFTNISWKYYLVYVCTNSLAFGFYWLFVPETKGRTLEDIDAFFVDARSVLEPVKIAKRPAMDFGGGWGFAEKGEQTAKHAEHAEHA